MRGVRFEAAPIQWALLFAFV